MLTEQLDPDGRKAWGQDDFVSLSMDGTVGGGQTIHFLTDPGPHARLGTFGRFGVPRTGPFGGVVYEGPVKLQGLVSRRYQVVSEADDQVTLAKSYAWEAFDERSNTAFELDGQGALVLDLNDGVPEQLTMRFTCHCQKSGLDEKFPLAMVYKRIEPNEVLEKELEYAEKYFRNIVEKDRDAQLKASLSNEKLVEKYLNEIDDQLAKGQSAST